MPASPKEFLEKKGRRSALTAMSELAEALPRKLRGSPRRSAARTAPRAVACVPMRVRRDALFESSVAQVLVATGAQKLAGLHVRCRRVRSCRGRRRCGRALAGVFRSACASSRPTAATKARRWRRRLRRRPRRAARRPRRGPRRTRNGVRRPQRRYRRSRSSRGVRTAQPLCARRADRCSNTTRSGSCSASCRCAAAGGHPCPRRDGRRKAMLGLAIVADDVQRLDPVYYKNRIAAVPNRVASR